MSTGTVRAARTGVIARGVTALTLAVVTTVSVAPFLGIAAGLLAGWTAFAMTSVVWVLLLVWRMDASRTRSHARAEDPGRQVARIVAVAGSIASLGAVAIVLIETRSATSAESFGLAAISLAGVASSWLLIQVDYMLRVAAVYYADPIGGIDFNQDDDPMYTDFAYFALGLGMAYQVADTNVRTNAIRRIVIAQSLLAYVFGAIILATVVNMVANLD